MNPLDDALDMELRSGISQEDVDAFANRMDMIAQAMEEIKNGTFDPSKCKIPGYKSPEQEEAEQRERIRRQEEQTKREQERKEKAKREEIEAWWSRAKIRFAADDESDHNCQENQQSHDRQSIWKNRVLAAYKARDANDYSVWAKWEPQDPATKEEREQQERELEKQRNKEFEANNPEFCSQFQDDLAKRQSSQKEKERAAEKLKLQGNQCYKRRQYDRAVKLYKEALEKTPFNVAVLTNISQSYLRQNALEDSIEFSTRALYVEPKHVKALSRRAAAYHQQQNLEKAATDMKQALASDPENLDIIEQHSIIVGEYEDSLAQGELQTALSSQTDNTNSSSLSRVEVEELRFVNEVLQRLNAESAPLSPDSPSMDKETQKDEAATLVQDAWVAYELLLPFLARNEHFRVMFRTSGEMHKLCDRIVRILSPADTFRSLLQSNSHAETIVGAMLDCAVSLMRSTPRNQILMFRHAAFRQCVLTFAESKIAMQALPLSLQSSVLQLLDEATDCKSWQKAMIVSESIVTTLLELMGEELLSKTASELTKTQILSSSSNICLTISGVEHGLDIFPSNCIALVLEALPFDCSRMMQQSLEHEHNVLGVLMNLSTSARVRKILDTSDLRADLARRLLDISSRNRLTAQEHDTTSSELALAALLNFSFDNASLTRRELVKANAVDHAKRILQRQHQPLLVLSRAVSLLCRTHSVIDANGTTKEERAQLVAKYSDRSVLDALYAVAQDALTSTSSPAETNQDVSVVTSEDTWQLCAQIWCHVGWCINEVYVRCFLREKKAISTMIDTIALVTSQPRSNASERLVGNITKSLIRLQNDLHPADMAIFGQKRRIKTVIDALQCLPNGLARKNVAILLAKLCQSDSQIKEHVRAMRGIEIMTSIGASLQTTKSIK